MIETLSVEVCEEDKNILDKQIVLNVYSKTWPKLILVLQEFLLDGYK